MNNLRAYIEGYEAIPDLDWDLIVNSFQRKVITSKDRLLSEGEVCTKLYFIESGLLRFFIMRNDIETTKFFTIAPYCFTSQASFNSGNVSNEFIEEIEKSVIWETTNAINAELLRLPSWNNFARKVTQEVQFFTEEILEDLQSETASFR